MTTEGVVGIVARRWYAVLLGLLLTATALHAVSNRDGVYSAEVDVVFLTPKSARFPNSIQQTSSSVVATAGLVERMLNGTMEKPAAASTGVTLAGQGIRQGYSLELPDTGGQWAHNFPRPVLRVQAVGPSAAWVQAEVEHQISRIADTLAEIQSQDRVRRSDWIVTSSSPASVDVAFHGGRPTLALAMTGLLGLWATLLAAVAVDQVVSRAGRRRRGALAGFALHGGLRT